jgi:hypothetical protein
MSKPGDEKLDAPVAGFEQSSQTPLGHKSRCKPGDSDQGLWTRTHRLNENEPTEDELMTVSKHSGHSPEEYPYKVWQVTERNDGANPYKLWWIDNNF